MRIMKKVTSLFLVVAFTASLIPQVFANDTKKFVSVDFSTSMQPDGLEMVLNPKGYVTKETSASFMNISGTPCVSIDAIATTTDSYAFFRIDDSWNKDINKDLYVLVDYYDSVPMEFYIEYEGTEELYQKTSTYKTIGSGAWKQAHFKLSNAKCNNGQRYGSDFRIVVKYGSSNSLCVNRVIVGENLNELSEYKPFYSPDGTEGGIVSDSIPTYTNGEKILEVENVASFDINDDFGKDMKDVLCTVMYYDDATQFAVVYDSNSSVQTDYIGGNSTDTWKSASFILEDARFDSCINGHDFEIVSNNGSSKIKSISMGLWNDESAANAVPHITSESNILLSVDKTNINYVAGANMHLASKDNGTTFSVNFSLDYSHLFQANKTYYAELKYVDKSYGNVSFKYKGTDNKEIQTGNISFKGTNKTISQYFVFENAVLSEGFMLNVNGMNEVEIEGIYIYAPDKMNAENIYSFVEDYCPTGKAASTQKMQGVRNWKYQQYSETLGYEDLRYTNYTWIGTETGDYPKFSLTATNGFWAWPGTSHEIVMSWTAPKDSNIVIVSKPRMALGHASSDGVSAKILKGEELLNSTVVSQFDTIGTETIINTAVTAGETIYFRLNCNGTNAYDRGYWNPTILITNTISEIATRSKPSEEAKIVFGDTVEYAGLQVVSGLSSLIYKSSYAVLTKDETTGKSEVAFKLDDEYRYVDTDVNPVYANLTFCDVDGINIWMEYTDVDGNIVKTDSVRSTQTALWKEISFNLKRIRLDENSKWDFKICTEQINGLQISTVSTSQVIYDSYCANFTVENSYIEDGLKFVPSASEGFAEDKQAVLNKNVISVIRKNGNFAFSLDDTYSSVVKNKNLYIEVEYLDNNAEFHIEYPKGNNSYYSSEKLEGTNELIFKKAVFVLQNPSFKNQQKNETDFRIVSDGDDRVVIHGVKISKYLFPHYTIGNSFNNKASYTGIAYQGENLEKKADLYCAKANTVEDKLKFDVDDEIFHTLGSKQGVYNLSVKYYDSNNLSFKVVYDSYESSQKNSWIIVGNGTNTWKTASFPITGARFANGQENGSDFYIEKVEGNAPLYISEVLFRYGLGEMIDIADENCIGESNDPVYDGDNLSYRLFAPTYKKYGNDGFIHGARNAENKQITVHFPTFEPIEICGVGTTIKFDDFYLEYLDLKNGEWTPLITVTNGMDMNSAYKIITFEPIETTAIRYVGDELISNGSLDKMRIFTKVDKVKDFHSGNIEISGNTVYEKNDSSANFNINVVSDDSNEKDYKLKVYQTDFYHRIINDNVVTKTISSNEEKNISVKISGDDFEESGAYYLVAELYNGNILIDKTSKLFGKKGVREIDPELSDKNPTKHRFLMSGAFGQWTNVNGLFMDDDVFEDFREQGYNSAQFEFYWGQIEPLPGVYEFEYIDDALKKAKDAGITLSLWFELIDTQIPTWYPEDENMIDQYGHTPAARKYDMLGVYPNINFVSFWSPTFIEYGEQCITEMINRYKDNPYVVGYGFGGLNCELSYPNGAPVVYDYSEPSQEAFVNDYLQEYLGLSLADLNARWNTNYSDWNEVRLYVPEEEVASNNSASLKYSENPHWVDTIQFQSYSKLMYVKRLTTLANTLDPCKEIGFFMQSPELYDEELIELAHKNGNLLGTRASNENAATLNRLSFIGNVVGGWVHGEPGDLPAKATALGNVGRVFFYTGMSGKASINWQGTLRLKGMDRAAAFGRADRYSGVEQIRDLSRLSETVLSAELPDNEVAVVYTNPVLNENGVDYIVARGSSDNETRDINENGVRGALEHSVLNNENYRGMDWLRATFAPEIYMSTSALSKYKLIIDCNSWFMYDEAQQNLAKYVQQGGKLVLFGDSSVIDYKREKNWTLLKLLSGGKAIPGDVYNTGTANVITKSNNEIPSDITVVLRKLRDVSKWDWAETIAEFAGQPVIKHWTYGSGEVIYVAGTPNVGAAGAGANEFFDALYDWANVSVKASGTGNKSNGDEIFSLYKGIKEHGNDKYLLLYPNEWSESSDINVKMNLLEEGKTYRVYKMNRDYDEYLQEYASGYLNDSINVPPAQVQVLKYTTDYIYSSADDFGVSPYWSYYEGDTKMNYNSEQKCFASTGNSVIRDTSAYLSSKEVSRKWTAPMDGLVSISGNTAMSIDGQNAQVTVKHGSKVIYSNEISGKNRNYIKNTFEVKKGDVITFSAKGNGTINWVPQIALSPSYVSTEFNNDVITIPEKCRVIVCGEMTSDGKMVVRICKNGQKLYGATVSPDFTEANHVWFDYGAEKGDKITLDVEGDRAKLTQNCKIWLVY